MGTSNPMNSNDLFDYAFGQLDGSDRERVDQWIASDPATAQRANHLRHTIQTLLDDDCDFEPPPGLAHRTARFVAEAARPRPRTVLDFVPTVVPFRPADIAVAAGIFLAGIMTLLPAVQRSRERMEVAGCTYNLQQIGRALWQYGSRHQHYPFGPEVDPTAPTGSYVAMLAESGLLTEADLRALDCPCKGSTRNRSIKRLADFRSLCRLAVTAPQSAQDAIGSDYAYNVGHYNASAGRVVPVSAKFSGTVPLLSDQPPHENFRTVHPGNSPNHGGRGQNVLYSDLHVGWHNTRRIGPTDPDLFLNALNRARPGVDGEDHALLPSMVPFLGWEVDRNIAP